MTSQQAQWHIDAGYTPMTTIRKSDIDNAVEAIAASGDPSVRNYRYTVQSVKLDPDLASYGPLIDTNNRGRLVRFVHLEYYLRARLFENES